MSDNDCNVLVIGEGLAGLMAAASAVSRGSTVRLVSTGSGTFVLGGACADLQGLASRETEWCTARELQEGISFFLEWMASAGCTYKGGTSDCRLVPSILGTFQEVSLAPLYLWKGDPREAAQVVVVGIDGLSGFDSEFMAERLSFGCEQMGLCATYDAVRIKLPQEHERAFTALDVATCIDRQQAFRDAVVSALEPLAENAELLILPGILGVNSDDEDISRLEFAIGCSVCELPTLPPSVPGLRLLRAFERALVRRGVDVCTGFAVEKLCIEGEHCTGVLLDTPGRPRLLHADSVVLACGRSTHLLDGSLQHGAVNRQLQPVGDRGAVIAQNVFECGSILQGFHPRHGNAIAIMSGYRAGMVAAEVGVHYAGR